MLAHNPRWCIKLSRGLVVVCTYIRLVFIRILLFWLRICMLLCRIRVRICMFIRILYFIQRNSLKNPYLSSKLLDCDETGQKQITWRIQSILTWFFIYSIFLNVNQSEYFLCPLLWMNNRESYYLFFIWTSFVSKNQLFQMFFSWEIGVRKREVVVLCLLGDCLIGA